MLFPRGGTECLDSLGDLAGLAPLYQTADLVDIPAGHGFPTDSVAHDQLCWHVITQATGLLRRLVVSGQTEEIAAPVTRIRTALSRLTV